MNTLQVDNVSKSFGRKHVLRDVSFSVAQGEVVGLLGDNGAGKSTLLRTMCGVDKPDRGSISFFPGSSGSPGGSGGQIRRLGAMIDPRWIDKRLTCSSHVRIAMESYGMRATRSLVLAALEEVGLGASARTRAGKLSLGMRQRLALCLAMLHEPSVLIFDEPANGLDPSGVLWLRELVARFARAGGSVLLSSHLMAEMERVVDRVLVLVDGRIATSDGHASWGLSDGVVATTVGPVAPLLSIVTEMGGSATLTGERSLLVRGLTPDRVFTAARDSGAVLTRLDETRSTLEDFYQSTVATRG
jgi:ABC-2 type transport system ATP-binding protein